MCFIALYKTCIFARKGNVTLLWHKTLMMEVIYQKDGPGRAGPDIFVSKPGRATMSTGRAGPGLKISARPDL